MATAAIVLTLVIHMLGIPVMIWAVRGDEGMKGLWDWLPRDDDEDGGGGSSRPSPPSAPAPSGGGLPLPVCEPASGRLRSHGDRVADPSRQPRRQARPAQPERVPAPQRTRR